MHIKLLPTLFTVFVLSFCSQKKSIPLRLQQGLISFIIQELPPFTNNNFPDSHVNRLNLWNTHNSINKKTQNDTLIIDVNTEIAKPLTYSGGFEFNGDTLILYAKNTSKKTTDSSFAILSYKIHLKGRSFSEIVFKELD